MAFGYANITDSPGYLGSMYGTDFTVESFPVASGTIAQGRPVYQTPGTPGTVKGSYTSGDAFIGFATKHDAAFTDYVGEYRAGDLVNVLSRGKLYAQAAVTISGAPCKVYVNAASGMVNTTASGNLDCGLFARTNATISGLVLIEIDGARAL